MLTLPTSLSKRFHTTYEGHEAAVFDNSVEYHNFTSALKNAGISFLTRIVKAKRNGKKTRSFVVLLVEDVPPNATRVATQLHHLET
jgi:hypothetical protein